jgi:hypothetical protein
MNSDCLDYHHLCEVDFEDSFLANLAGTSLSKMAISSGTASRHRSAAAKQTCMTTHPNVPPLRVDNLRKIRHDPCSGVGL